MAYASAERRRRPRVLLAPDQGVGRRGVTVRARRLRPAGSSPAGPSVPRGCPSPPPVLLPPVLARPAITDRIVLRGPDEAQDRPLRALVELVPDGIDPRLRPGAGSDAAAAAASAQHSVAWSRPSGTSPITGERHHRTQPRPRRTRRTAAARCSSTSRSIRSGWRSATSRPTAAPQSWPTSFTVVDVELGEEVARRTASGPRASNRGARPCPSARIRSGQARARRCGRGTRPSRPSSSGIPCRYSDGHARRRPRMR